MAKFRKRPVVIEAEQYDGTEECARRLGLEVTVTETGVQTREGFMRASPGDWIITGVAGERYPCKPAIFAATYDPVDELDMDRERDLARVGATDCPDERDERELDLVRLGEPPTDCEHFQIGHHALRVHVKEGGWVCWMLFQFAQCGMRGGVEVDHRYQVLAQGEGPSGSLREPRHTSIGEAGYVFYINPNLLSEAFKILGRWFDFEGV